MKILHIIPCLRKGGAERLVIDIVREIHRRDKIEVQLLIFRNQIEFEIDDLKPILKVIPASVHLSVLRKNVLNVDALNQFINSFEPNVIHSHLFEAEIVSRFCYFPKAKWFTHLHSSTPELNNLRLSEFFNKKTWIHLFEKRTLFSRYRLNGTTQFIAISEHIESFAKSIAPKCFEIHLLRNAIDFDSFFIDLKEPRQQEVLKLINVGRLLKNKNQIFLLEVLNYLKKRSISSELILLGDGPEMNTLKDKASHYGLKKEVRFEGNVELVTPYLRLASIFVHSAFKEGFGLVLVEAMAAGLPVVCLNAGGNADLIKQGENGFIFNEHDVEQFSEKIIELWEDESLYNRIRENAQEFARAFDIKNYVNNLLSLYSK